MYFIPCIFGICIVIYFIRGLFLNRRFKLKGTHTKGVVSDVVREGRAAYLFVSFIDKNGTEVSGNPANLKHGTLGYRKGKEIDVCYDAETPGSFIVASSVQAIFQIGGILFGMFLIGLGIFGYMHK
ncbi:DUF3592 domain-containing protein [Taibaiella soli]|uniref:DUF3592 domain-containing protein n=1 Tax=Taibaiella soli TaxID=1649169 RepID=A0A2W2AEF5_9BACT|nr:DUF3592 domain-containing protein [Taibaiella soli]PZF73671.1 hypothetical protein DN068_06645 [Taibaiella soli]